jgi:hypothetical protein
MRRLRQQIKSIRENGGSVIRFWRAKTTQSRIDLTTR